MSKHDKVKPLPFFPRIDTKREKTLFFVGVGLLAFGLIACAVFGVMAISKKDDSSDTIDLSGVDQSAVEDLKQQLVYSNDTDEGRYYSAELDSLLSYSPEDFNITEGADEAIITPSGISKVYAVVNLYEGSDTDEVKKVISNQYESVYSGFEVVKEEDDEEGYHNYSFQYTRKNYMTDEDETALHYVLIREEEAYTLSIEIRNYDEKSKNLLSKYRNILGSVEVHPENISEEIAALVKTGKIKLSFDRTMWELQIQTDYTVRVVFKSSDYETAQALKSSLTSINIYSNETDVYDEAALREKLTDMLNLDKESGKEDFEVIIEEDTRDIDGTTFYYYQYKYSHWSGVSEIEAQYLGYDEDAGVLIDISTSFPENEKSEGRKAIEQVLDTIDINSEDTETIAALPQTGEGDSEEIEKAVILGKPAAVHIFSKQCADLTFTATSGKHLGGNSYTICSIGSGSGFFIDKSGYIATNAHVAAGSTKDIILQIMMIALDARAQGNYNFPLDLDGLANDLYTEATDALAEAYPNISPYSGEGQAMLSEAALTMLIEILVDEGTYATIGNIERKNFIQKDEPFEWDIYTLEPTNIAAVYETELVSHNEINSSIDIYIQQELGEVAGHDVPDLAILKVTNPDQSEFHALRLADFDIVKEGDEVFAIGFPGRANVEERLSKNAQKIPTITNGNISAIKPSFNEVFDIIQFDASVAHGNSGGPLINKDGKVVGVVALLLLGTDDETDLSADFNGGVMGEELESMMETAGINNEIGEGTVSLETGLDYFSKDYYEWAKEELQSAKTAIPQAAGMIDPLLKIADLRIQAGDDNTPVFTIGDIYIHKNEMIIIIIIVVCVVLGLILVGIMILAPKKSKGSAPQAVHPQQHVQQPQPVQQPQQSPTPVPTQPTQSQVGTTQPGSGLQPKPVNPGDVL